jgi:hypothetical protein
LQATSRNEGDKQNGSVVSEERRWRQNKWIKCKSKTVAIAKIAIAIPYARKGFSAVKLAALIK